jgi:hypothetical protein
MGGTGWVVSINEGDCLFEEMDQFDSPGDETLVRIQDWQFDFVPFASGNNCAWLRFRRASGPTR